MPELAEVAFFARQWDAGRGQTVLDVHVHEKSRVFRTCDVTALRDGLMGTRLTQSRTHGKQMLFHFSGGHWLTVHLGMTGELNSKAMPYSPKKHDHLVLQTRKHALVFTDPRQFGSIQYHCGVQPPAAWQALPPQPMDEAFTLERLRGILVRHSRMPLKALLLDQRYFQGVGNWMADEVAWQMKLHPETVVASLDEKQIRGLHRVLSKVCLTALRTIGNDWSDPPRSWLFRYRWEKGHLCPRCGTALERKDVRGRTACWCPHCQAG